MATQIGDFTAQMANMAQQLAGTSHTAANHAAASPPPQPTTTLPRPATKPATLKLTLQKKAPKHRTSRPSPDRRATRHTLVWPHKAVCPRYGHPDQGHWQEEPEGPKDPNDQKVIVQIHPDIPPAKDIETT